MRELIEKAEVLIEAIPYIQEFRGKIVVVKYGGSTMDNAEAGSILHDIVFMECVGMRPVIVHGGGNAITTRLKERGIAPRFVAGLRITDGDAMKIVEEVLEEVNRGIVAKIEGLGALAKGLTGKDQVIRARKKLAEVDREGGSEAVDIGFVGDVVKIEKDYLKALCRKGVIPVIAPLGVDEEQHLYNINADTAAGEVAASLESQKLIFLTNVRGILRDHDDENSLIDTLRVSEVDALIEAKVIREGMLPKIRAGVKSVEAGVGKTHIIDGRLPHSMLLEIFTDRGIGTEISRD